MQVQEVQVLSRWHITVCNYNFRISAWILNATRCRDVGRGRSVNLPISARGPYYAHHLGQWTLTLPTTLLFAPPPPPSDFWTVPQWLFGLKNNSFQYWSTPRGPRGVKKSHFFFYIWNCSPFALRLPPRGINFKNRKNWRKNVKKTLFS